MRTEPCGHPFGKYSHPNGQLTNVETFDGSQQTFPKLLQQAGYQTALFGKWHLKSEPTGFDAWQVLIGQGPYYNPPIKSAAGVTEHVGYTTNIITDLALDWLKSGRDAQKPFMMMYQHKAPHRRWDPGPDHLTMYDDVEIPEPDTFFDDYAGRGTAATQQTMSIARNLTERDLKLVPPEKLTAEQLEVWNAAYEPKNDAFRAADLQGDDLVRWKYQRYVKDYLRAVAPVDDNIGRVLEHLEASGRAENTIVIYASDQGWYLGEHGWFDKCWMYEESLRMPLIVRWPGVTAPGSTSDAMVSNLDLAETFLDIAGVEIPSDMQGESLAPLLEGETPSDWRQSFYYQYYEYPGPHDVARHYGVRTESHKLIYFYTLDNGSSTTSRRIPTSSRAFTTIPPMPASGATSRLSSIDSGRAVRRPGRRPASRSSVTISRKLHDRDHPTFEKLVVASVPRASCRLSMTRRTTRRLAPKETACRTSGVKPSRV